MMSAHKSIDRICIIIVVFTLIITLVFCNGSAFGIETRAQDMGYENRIFDRSRVHTFDIVIDDWDAFLETCENEEYSPCSVVIDGEAIKNIGIRGKGNTSLSSVKNMDSNRYSFKVEFDQYEKGKTYHGLDKLCLNNIIQDNSYMKDYVAYTLMYDMGVDAPMCSYVYITVNGEDWGLYLAVESIEDSFLKRNYGTDHGELYKPDSMGFGGGGPGNGKDFSMTKFIEENTETDNGETESTDKSSDENAKPDTAGGMIGFDGNMPDFGGNMPDFGGEMPAFNGDMPAPDSGEKGEKSAPGGGMPGGFGGFGGMGSDDVKLKYIDDDIDSYSNIFGNAKTAVDTADKKRLIRSLKALSEQSDIENTVDIDEVIRYFVVHDFLCNGDSYTGMMIHNYYLYEKDGKLSMIPWDYNLAYGTFQAGDASSSVNSPIDTPVSGDMSDRPMIAWIFANEEYTKMYHSLFSEFLDSADISALVNDTADLIDKYVEKDPTKFCTYEDFQNAIIAMDTFCTLRTESVLGQLDGTIPSTSDGQNADSSALIDTSELDLSVLGSMNNGGQGGGAPFGGMNAKRSLNGDASADAANEMPDGFDPSQGFGGNMPEGFDPSQGFGGNMPDGFDPSQGFGGDKPEGFDPSQGFGGNMPEGFDPSQGFGGNMPEGFDPSQAFSGEMSDAPDQSRKSGADRQDNNSAPQGFGSEQEKDTLASDNKEVETAAAEQNTPDAPSQRPDRQPADNKDNRPQGGNFQPMDFNRQQDNSRSYILFGVSSLVLVLGIVFAAVFKR